MADKTTSKLFWAVTAAVVAIALGSFTLSYSALVGLAASNGVPGNLAYLWPLIVDISVVVFSGAILVAQLQNRGARLPIGLTMFYGVVTIAGNLLHAPATALGWLVGALPPLSLIFATEMLRAMAHHAIKQNNTVIGLQELTQQVDAKGKELAAISAQVDAKQKQLAHIQAEVLQAKSSKIDDFAESMLQGRQKAIAERRQQVLQLAREGLPEREIAAQLQKDPRTIRADMQALNGQVRQ
jgi:DNA-binding CsgD family transcriptional regulator